MNNSDKELITSDGRQGKMRYFCMAQMKKKRIMLMALLSLVGVLTLVVMFGVYAAIKVYNDDSTHFSLQKDLSFNLDKAAETLRNKRATNKISKLSEHDSHADNDKNMIKRNTDYEDVESYLNTKYYEINKNDASEETSDEDTFIQKRSSDLRNSIRRLEEAIEVNEYLVKSLIGIVNESDETANLISKDLNDVDKEIQALDDDIVGLLETAKMTDNSIHKRIRHKRETDFLSNEADDALKFFAPILEEKKREKRLVQKKLAEVRDEFIRCKKSAADDNPQECDGIYDRVMDRFREITKKFKEIEEIVEEMEHFKPSTKPEGDERKKKKDKKKKKKSSEESKESKESSEDKKEKTSTTVKPASSTSEAPSEETSEAPSEETSQAPLETTTNFVETTTEIEESDETTKIPFAEISDDNDSSENKIRVPSSSAHRTSSKVEDVVMQPVLSEGKSSTISSKIVNSVTDSSLQMPASSTCPAGGAFNSDIIGHPKFQEDLAGPHSSLKFFQNHHIVDDLVARKIERKQRGPFFDTISDLFEDAGEMADGAKFLIDDTFGNNEQSAESDEVGKAHSKASSPSPTFKNSEVNAPSGPFMSLCEQLSKQSKQAQQGSTQVFDQQHSFAPVSFPLSGFASPGLHFPATGETMKATSKTFMNPGFNMMPYPVCFVNYPQYRIPQQQQFYYPGLMPMTQPGGKVDKTHPDNIDPEFVRFPWNSGGYFMPSAGANLRPFQVPITNQNFAPNQAGYRAANEEPQPTYCTFLASDGANFPAHYSETTEQPETTAKYAATTSGGKIEEYIDEPERSDDGNRASAYNIPSQFDIIYATYPNQLYAMNHSLQHHHCDAGKLPCFGTNQCISKASWCDSKVDCLDASDETACSCKARLTENRICDGFVDCPMASDEMGCFGCDKFQFSCYNSRKEFEANGESSSLMCYSSVEKCDGFTNCKNGKDESECSMIVKHVGAMLSYAVSHSEGILHHNFKGRWYPVCKNANRWAIEACEMEVGRLSIEPFMAIKSIQIPGPFIQPNVNQQNQAIDTSPTFSDTCQLGKIMGDENHVMFVKCPQPHCGSSKIFDESLPTSRETQNSTRNVRDVEERIVGGIDAKSMEFPFIVAIYKDGNFHCGGSIYNEHWIITAAHCTRSFENHFYEIRAGILRRSSYAPSAQYLKVSHVIRHPDYERATMKNDIALMKVKHHLSFNRWVRPICMPAKGRSAVDDSWKFAPVAGTMCSTLGWGAIREKGPDPDDLKVVDVPIISKCKYVHDQEGESVCAGETFGTRDACQGDSGGPLVCKSVSNPSELYLTGIVSHGEGCARANEPGVYTRVALYLDWIIENSHPNQPLPLNLPRQNCPGHVCVWGGSKCISKAERCDGIVDCLGGEDEVECTLNLLDLLLGSNGTETNSTSNFTSINPVNVTENADEASNKTVTKKDIKNDSFRCTKIPQVINIDQRCDRIFDCEDGTDEMNCTCRDHLKLAFAKLICDGHVDCADSTDEIGCLTCNETEFACKHSEKCIDKSLHCNGEVDCKFREDELECLALTDGHSVMLDVNGKPFMHFKGIVTQNVQSTWKILCDDNEDFHTNGSQIADDVCNVIGFKSAKSLKFVEITSSHVDEVPIDPTHKIDIRNPMIRSKENVSQTIEKCTALEIECIPFQSNSFAIHPIQHDKIKKNSTAHVHHNEDQAIIFVPVNSTDQSHIIVEPSKKGISEHEWNSLRDFNWPWSAGIYMNGNLVTNGILLDKSWVLVEKNHFGSSQEPLHENHVVAVFGHSKAHLNIQSPYEQHAKVDCLQFVNDSNLMLLHLENPIDFNRHVLPSFIPAANKTQADSRCLVIALDSQKSTKSLELQIVKNCNNNTNQICYQQAANVTEILECDGETSHRVSTIVCKIKLSGWYPKAFHQLQKGFCDFLKPISARDVISDSSYNEIQQIIDHPCEKCRHHAINIKCETHRCPFGKCLEKHQLCDGIDDCNDGSDEKHEVCDKISHDQKSCSPSEFRCKDGKCIEKSKFCNHMADCADKTDEPTECTCFTYLRATDPSKLCDGIRHCWDKSDENPTYCGFSSCADMSSFKCGGSEFCVPHEMVCDKRADCPNGADELYCHGIYNYDTSDGGYGEVMERSFGIWHTKCFPKSTPPTQEELEDLCKQLGFKNTTNAMTKIKNSKSNITLINFDSAIQAKKSTPDKVPIKFQMFNSTKVIAYTKFSPVKLNDGFTVHLRSSKPLAKLVQWDKNDHENCHRMEIKCIEENQ